MTEREQFEAWAHKAHYNLGVGPNGLYQSGRTSSAWASWQASTQRQQERIAELQAQVQALSLDSDRYQFAIDSSIEYGRLNFKAIYDAWDGDGSFTDQIDTAIAAGKGEG